MRGRSFILRCLTFLLLLVFSQKIGVGLFLHNLLHKETAVGKFSNNSTNKEVSFACNCIDDFLMPLEEAEEPVVFPAIIVHQAHEPFFETIITDNSPLHFSLRGPPASIL